MIQGMPVIIRGARVRFLQSKPGDGPKPPPRPPCEYCGKASHKFAAAWGWHHGNPTELRENILAGRKSKEHPWYTGRWTIAAHHLICSEAMADDELWARFCRDFGYDINRRENGVMLPMVLAVACELHVPVHIGPHSGGWAFDMDLAYPEAVKRLLAQVAQVAAGGAFCSNPNGLTAELDDVSQMILRKLAAGQWTLTTDGLDYLPGGSGCAGVESIQDKPRRACPRGRKHGASHGDTGAALARRALQVGE
ncbi:AHH domain-containing protein [Myxococcus sp. SDU36]|uniref:AHH domain-containing protein n=1 Tax=Myxococcus sp. SDU36 TaxID=2831967 RepID=UPI002543CAD7|nr:AHH domain-containing protein [Myxococcus sp. SDU36]